MAAKTNKDDDQDGPAHGSNVPDGEKVLSFLERYENLEDDIAKEKAASKLQIDAIKDDQAELCKEAKKAGLRKKAFMAQIKRRKLERQLAEHVKNLESNDQASYEAMNLALEKLGPLGTAALKAA